MVPQSLLSDLTFLTKLFFPADSILQVCLQYLLKYSSAGRNKMMTLLNCELGKEIFAVTFKFYPIFLSLWIQKLQPETPSYIGDN